MDTHVGVSPHEISSEDEIDELCAAIMGTRDETIVAFTSAQGSDRPAIDPSPLCAVADEIVRVVFLRNGPLTHRLAAQLPEMFAVYGGGGSDLLARYQ